jgi:hypothetical protein
MTVSSSIFHATTRRLRLANKRAKADYRASAPWLKRGEPGPGSAFQGRGGDRAVEHSETFTEPFGR